MIGDLRRRAEPHVVVESFGYRHRFPARAGADHVVGADIAFHSRDLTQPTAADEFANVLIERITSLHTPGLQDPFMFAYRRYHSASLRDGK